MPKKIQKNEYCVHLCPHQIETETGSAGKRPVKDRFDTQTECQKRGLSCEVILFDIPECFMPKKIHK
jgi:hypothetical protein